MDPSPSPFLLVEEAADYCGTSVSTIRRWIREGKIPSHRIGRRYLIPRRQFFDSVSEGAQLVIPFPKESDDE